MFRCHRALSRLRGAAFAYRVGEMIECAFDFVRQEKLQRAADKSGRFGIQEHRAVRRERVLIAGLCQQPQHRQVVAQDANAARRRVAMPSDYFHGCGRAGHRGEQIQFDCRLDRGGLLVGVDGVENERR